MIRLIIADDHPIVREGLRRIIDDCPDIQVVGEANDGDTLREQLPRLEADVLVLDISMPGPPFLELMAQLRSEWPTLKVLIVSAHPEDQYATRALRAGAVGYLTKDQSTDELAEAIRRVFRGGRYITARLAERLAFDLDPEHRAPLHARLSDREFQVLVMLSAGNSLKEIAGELGVSAKTVSTYRTRVLSKLDLRTNADLVRYAIEHDLCP